MSRKSAWMLARNGTLIPCEFHPYVQGDEDFSSEAEVASFLLKNKAHGSTICYKVIEAWVDLGIRDSVLELPMDTPEKIILELAKSFIKEAVSEFQFKMSLNDYLIILKSKGHFKSVFDFYDLDDEVQESQEKLSQELKETLNQQFTRVRYGGMLNTVASVKEIYFRISSVGYDWTNVIYKAVVNLSSRYKIDYVTVCRDKESDGITKDKFYKGKNDKRVVYNRMPVAQFLSGELESNPLMETQCKSSIDWIRYQLQEGSILNECIGAETYDFDKLREFLLSEEYKNTSELE